VQQPETLNPLNHLPVLTQERAPSQALDLPTERTSSSIHRDAAERWEYPSPQQFYNALVRKGWETPENEIETMVQIHNFLNEKAWEEVQKWEAQVNRCVSSSA
jgi:cytochrome c heme-lyase